VAEAAEKTVAEFERKPERNAFLINELMGLRNAIRALKGNGNEGN
jgi:hypothetical protein